MEPPNVPHPRPRRPAAARGNVALQVLDVLRVPFSLLGGVRARRGAWMAGRDALFGDVARAAAREGGQRSRRKSGAARCEAPTTSKRCAAHAAPRGPPQPPPVGTCSAWAATRRPRSNRRAAASAYLSAQAPVAGGCGAYRAQHGAVAWEASTFHKSFIDVISRKHAPRRPALAISEGPDAVATQSAPLSNMGRRHLARFANASSSSSSRAFSRASARRAARVKHASARRCSLPRRRVGSGLVVCGFDAAGLPALGHGI